MPNVRILIVLSSILSSIGVVAFTNLTAQQPALSTGTNRHVQTPKQPNPDAKPGTKMIKSWQDCDNRYDGYGTVIEVNSSQVKIKEAGVKGFPILTYHWHAMLLDGQVAPNESDGWWYLPSQVQIGDMISVAGYKDEIDGNWYAALISIRYRSKGDIPPSQKPSDHQPFHQIMNYRAKWEHEGIHMPDHWVKEYYDGVHPPPPPKPAPLRDPPKDR